MKNRSLQRKKKSRAIAHEVSREGRQAYAPVAQRMQGNESPGFLGSILQWGNNKLQESKNFLYNYLTEGRTILNIAEATGFGIFTIREMLSDPNPDVEKANDLVDLLRKKFDYSLDNPLTSLVPSSLISDLPDGEQEKVDEIFSRINKFPFTYTGRPGDGASGFLLKSGDCRVLAEMFIYAVKAAGIDNIQLESCYDRMLVKQAGIHGRNTNGNTQSVTGGNNFWAFYDHFWASYNGQHYDLLFRRKGYPAMIKSAEIGVYRGIHYRHYENGRCLVQPEFLPQLKLQPEPGKEGLLLKTNELQPFIDKQLGN